MFYRSLGGARASVADLTRLAVPALRNEFRTLVVMGVVCGLLGLLVPATAGVLIDDVIPRADRPALATLCGFLVAVGLSIAGFQAVQGFALVRIRGRLESTLLPALWDRLFSLPPRFFSGQESGELSLRALGLSRVIEVLTGTAVATLTVSVFSFMNVIILFAFHARLAALALALIAVAPLTLLTALPFLWRRQRRISRAQGKISSLLLMLLGGVSRLRVAGAERRAFALWASRYRGQLEQALKYQQLSDRLVLFGDVWPLLALMAVFAAVAAQDPGEMSTGDLIAFNLAAGQALAAVIGLGKAVLPLLNGLEQYERFRPILEARPETEGVVGGSVKLGGAVRLSNVSFRYDPDGPLVLDDVSVQVRPGEFVAIVGPSGSGKSTLLRLLLGFETPTEGSVSYDGRDLSTLDVQEVRRQAGVVLQDAQLLPGDVYTNIVGFAPNLSRDDAWRAAELAGLADDIEAMPMGIHTVIGEGGGGLSSGQRQRLIIARALAGGPKVLYFDEATSALDNLSQALISRSIHTKLRGTSRLVIAHRLSTVADADRIYVMSGGRVVQHGRYAQLIDEPGPFRDLARRQSLV
ncbi:MAG: ATP-binding cassette domain-containing protein [Isosphaeraceae bacterium]